MPIPHHDSTQVRLTRFRGTKVSKIARIWGYLPFLKGFLKEFQKGTPIEISVT